MPTRTLQRFKVFSVEDIYTSYLSGQSGWSGGSAEDIVEIIWDGDPLVRAVTIKRKYEAGLQRSISFTDTEIYTLVSGLSGWSGGATVINRVEYDAAGRKMVIIKNNEAA